MYKQITPIDDGSDQVVSIADMVYAAELNKQKNNEEYPEVLNG